MNLPPLLQSRKFWSAALATLVLTVPLALTLTDKNLPRESKATAAEVYIVTVGGIWGIKIAGTAFEDAASKYNPVVSPGAAVQVNPQAQTAEQTVAAPAKLAGLTGAPLITPPPKP